MMKYRWLSALFVACIWGSGAFAEQTLQDGLYAEMNTSKGKIVLELYYQKTPLTVTNFVALAEGKMKTDKRRDQPFFDGLAFHRVIPNFMIQGGCPLGNGMGGPGYRFPDEIVEGLKHSGPGILSMANAGPGTNGSQFFITHKATPWLDGKHTVFGKVVTGQQVVDSIAKGDKITTVKIVRQGADAKAFKADHDSYMAHLEGINKVLMERGKVEAAKRAAAMAELEKKYEGAIKTASGLRYVVTQKGTGDSPKRGQTVVAHYTGKLTNGKVFDSSLTRGRPFEFPVGQGRVIKGWDEAFLGMNKGEKRTLIIPPELGYGARGAGGVIPPNATLIFDVELIDFR